VCIIGGGPCGMVLAQTLAARGRDVLLVESGHRHRDDGLQSLNHGEVRGVAYAGLAATRHRQFGGTPHTWNTPLPGGAMGAKYCPLDALDLARWPLAPGELVAYYDAAQRVCGLGRFAYDAAEWRGPGLEPWDGPGDLENAVYQFGPGELFIDRLPRELLASAGVRVLTGVTACRLERQGSRVTAVEAALDPAHRLTIRADMVILATGGVENARLLLASGISQDWLGRGFMEHPRDYSLVLEPSPSRTFGTARFYDRHAATDGTILCGRLGLSAAARRREGLPNASVTLHLRRRPGPEPFSRRLLRRLRLAGPPFGGGYGWSDRPGLEREFNAFRLVVNFEQFPHRDNRLLLDGPPDPFGIPRAVLHYAWRPEEQAGLDRLRGLLARWFQDAGHGALRYREGIPPDLSAHHHLGLTRMSHDPADGVVTPECRVHGVDNLHVVGASVFPTGGFANPTLTAIALALRLADQLPHA
ncbi:MAG: FAD-dependent oxidoreductase, partial [Gemmatimonadales bacterium]